MDLLCSKDEQMESHSPTTSNSGIDDAIPSLTSLTTQTGNTDSQLLCFKRLHSSDICGIRDSSCADGVLFTPCEYYLSGDNTCRDNCDTGAEDVGDILSVNGHLCHKAVLPCYSDIINNSTFSLSNHYLNEHQRSKNDSKINSNIGAVLDCCWDKDGIFDTSETSDALVNTYSCNMSKITELHGQGTTGDINSSCSRNSELNNSRELLGESETSFTINSSASNNTGTKNCLCHIETICTQHNSVNSPETDMNSSTYLDLVDYTQHNIIHNGEGKKHSSNSIGVNYMRYSSINSVETGRNSSNQAETGITTTQSLSRNPAVSLLKPSLVLLPPCRICGAKASGFHYGVNSCEACKGFFRRALKRPLAFQCTKNRKCDVNGNKRSSCRSCRYKRCLRLGMSVESIKTGRYSHKKRTSDTIEVKTLQNSPNEFVDEVAMDAIIETLTHADERLVTSPTNLPKDVIYRKQLEFYNSFNSVKKFGNCIKFDIDNDKHSSIITDRDWNRKCDDEIIETSTPSIFSSELSPDSGIVDEFDSIIDNNKCEVSQFEPYTTNKDLPDLIPFFADRSGKTTREISYIDYLQLPNIQAEKHYQENYIKKSALNNDTAVSTIELPESKHQHTDNAGLVHCYNNDYLKQHVTENSEQNCNNWCLTENLNKQSSSGNMYKPKVVNNPSSQEQIEITVNHLISNATSGVLSKDMTVAPKTGYHCVLDGKSGSQHEGYVPASSPDSVFIYRRQSQDYLARETTRQPEISENSTKPTFDQNYHFENMSKNSSRIAATHGSDDTTNLNKTNSTKGQVSKVDSKSTLKMETELEKKIVNYEFYDSVSMRRESQDVAILRAKKWIRGYIDFAKSIRGFESLTRQDQAALLKHAWDEVWILGTYSCYNSHFPVVMAPGGNCFHGDEMERMWGEDYARISFTMAGILKGHNLTPGLITLLKAVCVVSPDRCQLLDPKRVADIHWMMVSCLLRHIQMTYPGDHMVFPRMVSVLTSLRVLSELARRELDNGCVKGRFDCRGMEALSKFF